MQNNHAITRRGFVAGLSGITLIAGFAMPALALNDQQASALISKLVKDLNAIINSGKSQSALFRDFEALFNKYGDVPIIARSALGLPWRTATASQQSRYVKAFSTYMARKWGKRFNEFKGGDIKVTGSKKAKGNYLVSSLVHLPGQAPFEVDWQVSDKSGRDLMFNLFIEGVSLLVTERTEIASMLDKRKGNLDQLITDLKNIK